MYILLEFQRFAPTVPVMLYHGSKEERRIKWASLKKVRNFQLLSCASIYFFCFITFLSIICCIYIYILLLLCSSLKLILVSTNHTSMPLSLFLSVSLPRSSTKVAKSIRGDFLSSSLLTNWSLEISIIFRSTHGSTVSCRNRFLPFHISLIFSSLSLSLTSNLLLPLHTLLALTTLTFLKL
jgi:hypothetical protein